MRFTNLLGTPILFLSCGFAQIKDTGTRTIYYLQDAAHKQWCGYSSEARMKSQIQPLRSMILGKAEYENDRVSKILVTEADETGDWAVNDEYAVSGNGKIQSLKRTINIIPEDISEEQQFVIENGKPVKQRSALRELRTGRPTQKSVDWFQPPTIVISINGFPFSGLLLSKKEAIWLNGELCVPDSN